jgi:SAM-dependent methyltransferase
VIVPASDRLAAAFACPACRRDLHVEDASATCHGCGQVYPTEREVRILLADREAGDRGFYTEEDAARYGRDEQAMPEQFSSVVRAFLAEIPEDALVVELGCGQGAFAGWHPGAVATDYSFYALDRFVEGLRIQCDAHALPFGDATVDAFFSVAMLEHVQDPARVADEIHRCLRPGGRALLYPAWYVRPWTSRALEQRAYADLGLRERLEKASILIRDRNAYRFLRVLPGRLRRELAIARRRQVVVERRRLQPNLDTYLCPDSDAFSSLDPQALASFFVSRGYADERRPNALARIFYAFEPVIVAKP